jgi:hypothetical protein
VCAGATLVWSASEILAGNASEDVMSTEAPERVLKLVVDGINTGNLDALMSLCEPEAAFALQTGAVAQGLASVRESLEAFIAMKGFVLDNPWANSDTHLVSGIVDELKGVAEDHGVSFYVHMKEEEEENTES